jgi:mono/diheme cytochrome c family protein
MDQKILILMSLVVMLGCNRYSPKHSAATDDTVVPAAAAIDYQYVQGKVFTPYCLRCHSAAAGNAGDVNLETYESVIFNLVTIKQVAVVEGSMPPKKAGGALSAFPKEVLQKWLEEGAPEKAGVPAETQPKPETPPTTPETPAQPAPVPPVTPPAPENPAPPVTPPAPVPGTEPVVILPTWNDIHEKIFVPKCVRCHSAEGRLKDLPLTDMAFVVNPANDLVTPGQPDSSGLVDAITRVEDRMPPAKTGMTLSQQEIDAIKTWIANGAKD